MVIPYPDFSIPDPGVKKALDPTSRSAASILTQKFLLSSRKYDPG
jgi:hypothetical protein